MSSRIDSPIFNDGICIITDFEGRNLELNQTTWKNHILGEHKRDYFRNQFSKIILTIEQPDRIIDDSKEKNVVHYEKIFEEFFIMDSIHRRMYLYVIANWKTMRIRTIYINPKQRTKGKVIWQRVD